MTDWAAKWFEIRAEMGQPDTATMMYRDNQNNTFTRSHFKHRESDGFGKIQSLLKNEGLFVNPPIRSLKKPFWFFNFYLLIRGLLTHPRLPHNPWKNYYPSKASGGPDDVSYLFLTPDENKKIKLAAKEKKLNLGFYILSELDLLLKNRLFKNSQESGTWLCPVDLRGAFQNAPLNHNCVSFVPVKLTGKDPALAFEQYRKSLRSGSYWMFWQLAQIGKWIGLKGMRWLAKKSSSTGSFWMGSFSDLGVWNQEVLLNSPARYRYWVIAPPGSHSYPIGITTIEWCGNRSITLKIHPGICYKKSTQLSDEILSEFRANIKSSIAIQGKFADQLQF